MRGPAVLVCMLFLASVSLCQADTSGISTQFQFSNTLVIGTKGANGIYGLQFAAYRTSTGGSPIGTLSNHVGTTIKKGLYSVTLDFGPDVFNGEPVWVEVRYAKLGTIDLITSPQRIKIGAQPYSMTTAHASVADYATTAGFAAQTILATHSATADVATTATTAIPYSGTAYEVVKVTDVPKTNGENLRAAYDVAKALTPHGAPLSARNRAAVLVPPGYYDIFQTPLALDTEFVDLIGLSSNCDNQFIDGWLVGGITNTGVLRQTANDVHIENISADISRCPNFNSASSSDVAAYFPNSGLTATVLRNCRFRSDNTHGWSMRLGTTYAGTYENCKGELFAFGGRGTASGTFINCTGGGYSFGSEGTASGTFKSCTGGDFSFGGSEFGSPAGLASGTFTSCTGGTQAFGSRGVASGLFKDCTGGSFSFGSTGSAAGGRFFHCVGVGGGFSFTTSGSPVVHFCVNNNAAYP